MFLAPLSIILTQGSDRLLPLEQLLIVCATLRLDKYVLTVLLFSPRLETAQVAKALVSFMSIGVVFLCQKCRKIRRTNSRPNSGQPRFGLLRSTLLIFPDQRTAYWFPHSIIYLI